MRRLTGIQRFLSMTLVLVVARAVVAADSTRSAHQQSGTQSESRTQFVQKYCLECHDSETRKGSLDLTALKFELAVPTNFTRWVLVHDRVTKGEMPPPKKKERPDPDEAARFTKSLSSDLAGFERARMAREGRATR